MKINFKFDYNKYANENSLWKLLDVNEEKYGAFFITWDSDFS